MERICESESGIESTYGSKREGDLRMRKRRETEMLWGDNKR